MLFSGNSGTEPIPQGSAGKTLHFAGVFKNMLP